MSPQNHFSPYTNGALSWEMYTHAVFVLYLTTGEITRHENVSGALRETLFESHPSPHPGHNWNIEIQPAGLFVIKFRDVRKEYFVFGLIKSRLIVLAKTLLDFRGIKLVLLGQAGTEFNGRIFTGARGNVGLERDLKLKYATITGVEWLFLHIRGCGERSVSSLGQ